jgi:hypothetical protein
MVRIVRRGGVAIDLLVAVVHDEGRLAEAAKLSRAMHDLRVITRVVLDAIEPSRQDVLVRTADTQLSRVELGGRDDDLVSERRAAQQRTPIRSAVDVGLAGHVGPELAFIAVDFLTERVVEDTARVDRRADGVDRAVGAADPEHRAHRERQGMSRHHGRSSVPASGTPVTVTGIVKSKPLDEACRDDRQLAQAIHFSLCVHSSAARRAS